MAEGGLSGTVLNAAKEVALEAFIDGTIGFLDMADIVERTMDRVGTRQASDDITDVYAADRAARVLARELAQTRNCVKFR
jgi:1-deoxy-D-xylulose-5-phosphate reductoisomerase